MGISIRRSKDLGSGSFTLPSGIINPFAGITAPDGWLLCYGQAISRTVYSDLFIALSTTYGAGDGSTTFNVPDLRGRVVAGLDNMGGTDAGLLSTANTLGTTTGTETITLTTAQMPSHTHIQDAHNHTKTTSTAGSVTQRVQIGSGTSTNDAFITDNATATNQNTGGGTSHNNMQPTMTINYIIKV